MLERIIHLHTKTSLNIFKEVLLHLIWFILNLIYVNVISLLICFEDADLLWTRSKGLKSHHKMSCKYQLFLMWNFYRFPKGNNTSNIYYYFKHFILQSSNPFLRYMLKSIISRIEFRDSRSSSILGFRDPLEKIIIMEKYFSIQFTYKYFKSKNGIES